MVQWQRCIVKKSKAEWCPLRSQVRILQSSSLLWLFTLHINLKRVCRRHLLQYQDGQRALASVNKIGLWAFNGNKEQPISSFSTARNGVVENVGEGAICCNCGAGCIIGHGQGKFILVATNYAWQYTSLAIGHTGPLTVEGCFIYIIHWLDQPVLRGRFFPVCQFPPPKRIALHRTAAWTYQENRNSVIENIYLSIYNQQFLIMGIIPDFRPLEFSAVKYHQSLVGLGSV